MRLRAIATAATWWTYTASIAFAVDSGGHHEGDHGGLPVATLIFSAINLLIFLFIIRRYAFPAVKDWVKTRRDNIVEELEQAAIARAEAQRLQGEWQKRLNAFDETVAQMKKQSREDTERERERILIAAKETAQKITEDAKKAAVYEATKAQAEIQSDLLRQAVLKAEERVRANWSSEDQGRFVTDFLKQVQK